MSEENMITAPTPELDSLEERLRQAADEIDNIKDNFTKGAQDLSRIKNMLEIHELQNITQTLEKYEGQLCEVERQREEAYQGAQKYSEELEKEKERLIKLWDAYKNQEEELSTTEKKLAEYEERARVAESAKKQVEDDYAARINTLQQKITENQESVAQVEQYKERCAEFDNVQNNLESEINTLKCEIDNKDSTIETLQKQVEEWKQKGDSEEYKEKLEEVTHQYEKEKERLTKLYQLYEETETECKRLRGEVKGWQNWFESNKEVFDRLFSAAPPSTTVAFPKETSYEEPETTTENKNAASNSETKSKPKRKKLRLKK